MERALRIKRKFIRILRTCQVRQGVLNSQFKVLDYLVPTPPDHLWSYLGIAAGMAPDGGGDHLTELVYQPGRQGGEGLPF